MKIQKNEHGYFIQDNNLFLSVAGNWCNWCANACYFKTKTGAIKFLKLRLKYEREIATLLKKENYFSSELKRLFPNALHKQGETKMTH